MKAVTLRECFNFFCSWLSLFWFDQWPGLQLSTDLHILLNPRQIWFNWQCFLWPAEPGVTSSSEHPKDAYSVTCTQTQHVLYLDRARQLRCFILECVSRFSGSQQMTQEKWFGVISFSWFPLLPYPHRSTESLANLAENVATKREVDELKRWY